MDISNSDVILSMDWLTPHRVVIDCDSRRITTYTRDSIRVTFQGKKHDALPQTVHNSIKWTVNELARKTYPRGRGETGFESTSGGLRV